MTTVNLNTKVELDLKNEVENVLTSFGVSLNEAILMFLNKVKLTKKLPFDIEIITENDDDYKILQKTRDEETYSLKEFLDA